MHTLADPNGMGHLGELSPGICVYDFSSFFALVGREEQMKSFVTGSYQMSDTVEVYGGASFSDNFFQRTTPCSGRRRHAAGRSPVSSTTPPAATSSRCHLVQRVAADLPPLSEQPTIPATVTTARSRARHALIQLATTRLDVSAAEIIRRLPLRRSRATPMRRTTAWADRSVTAIGVPHTHG
jgi:hypothetical protein